MLGLSYVGQNCMEGKGRDASIIGSLRAGCFVAFWVSE